MKQLQRTTSLKVPFTKRMGDKQYKQRFSLTVFDLLITIKSSGLTPGFG